MTTQGTNAGFLVGNLLDGTGGARQNKVVVAYNGSEVRGIWFSEPDSSAHYSPTVPIDELDADYTTAMSFVNAQGGYAMLVPNGTNAITKLEIYNYPSNTGSSGPVASNLISYSTQNVTIPNAVPVGGNSATVGKATDITLDVHIPDGAGTATLSNGTAGTFNGTSIFPRNAASQTVTVSVTGITVGPLDQVRLTVPSDFTNFSSGNVSLGGAFAGKSTNIVGRLITVLSANLGTTPGTISVSGLTSPNPVGAQLTGNSDWKVETAASGGTLTEILASPKSFTIIPISNIRSGSTDGYGNHDAGGDTVAMNGITVATSGVATIENGSLQATNANFVIQSGGKGIEVFRYGVFLTPFSRGDSVVVKGVVTAYAGSAEIIPNTDGNPDFFVIGAGIMPAPLVLPTALSVAEPNECVLIRLNAVTYDSAGQTFIATVTNRGMDNFHKAPGDSGTIYLGAANPLVGSTIPVSGNLIGISLQRNFVTGSGQTKYKVGPRDQVDLGLDLADGTGTATMSPAYRFTGLTATAETLTVTGDGVHTLAGVSVAIPLTWTWTNTASYTLSGAGFSSASASVSGDGSTTPYTITVNNASVTGVNVGKIAISNLNTPSATGVTTFDVMTRGLAGLLSNIAAMPTVNITGQFEAVNTGNWNQTSVWAGGVVPGAGDDVTMTTKNVLVTLTAAAACHNLTMVGVDTAGGAQGPVLAFQSSGAVTLTVNGRLDISGVPGRPQLTSNGNASATLVAKGYVFSNVSNAVGNGNRGLNMNEGTVRLTGASSDTLKTGAGIRLGNLFIGDGVSPKTVLWHMTSSATLDIQSLTIKTGSTFILGATTVTTTNSIGNYSTTGIPLLTGGITVENSATLRVNNASSGSNYAYIDIKDGGFSNSGTVNLKSPDGSRRYHMSFGGLPLDPSGSKQTVGGSAIGTYANISLGGALDTLILNQSMNLDTLTIYGTLVESAGHVAVGTAKVTRTLAQSVSESFGGIGVTINALGAAPGVTNVMRVSGTAKSGGGNSSIKRFFDITPATNTGLNATLDFSYDASELNGQDAATLQLWKSIDGGTIWSLQGGTPNVGNHLVHLTGVGSFSLWTASDAAHPLGSAAQQLVVNKGWNMISLPLTVLDARKTTIFPEASSSAFAFTTQYETRDTLKNGVGYWIKFASQDTITVTGLARTLDTVYVNAGWNLIGSIAYPVPKATIIQNPASNVISSYYFYTGSYQNIDILLPWDAYWVKTASPGILVLSSGGPEKQSAPASQALTNFNTITVTDKSGNAQTLFFGEPKDAKFEPALFELPPLPPEGGMDVRFGSQRYAEALPDEGPQAYPIHIQATSYPLTLSWHVAEGALRSFMLTGTLDGGASLTRTLAGEGKLVLGGPATSLTLSSTGGRGIPAVFALSANYPNPFNPSTNFIVAVPKAAQVEVVVYDILGRKVRTLVAGQVAAGYHAIEWNGLADEGSPVTSGVYFVRMVSESFNAVQKVMMMK